MNKEDLTKQWCCEICNESIMNRTTVLVSLCVPGTIESRPLLDGSRALIVSGIDKNPENLRVFHVECFKVIAGENW